MVVDVNLIEVWCIFLYDSLMGICHGEEIARYAKGYMVVRNEYNLHIAYAYGKNMPNSYLLIGFLLFKLGHLVFRLMHQVVLFKD